MTDQPSRADLARVVTGLDQLEDRIDDAKAQSKRTADRHTAMVAVALGAALIGGFVGVQGWLAAGKAQDAIDAVEEQRATARVSSCEQAVDFATAHNELVQRTQDLLLTIAAGSNRPETQAFVDEQVALYEANIVRVRDCSAEGLEAFANGTGGYLP